MLVHQFFKRFSRGFASAAGRRFRSDKSGNVAIIFAMSLVPIMLCLNIAIDVTRSTDEKSRLDAAVDSAVLFAVAKAAQSGGSADYAMLAKSAQGYFDSQVGNMPNLTISPLAISVSKSGTSSTILQAVASYSGTIQSWVKNPISGEMVTIPISGYARAEIALPSYIDFYLLLDNSPSMGLAASPAEITKMRTATTAAGVETCEFACHSGSGDTYSIARTNNIQLRVDLLAQATSALTASALKTQNKSGLPNQFRMGIYSFSDAVTVLSASSESAQKKYTSDNGLLKDLAAAGTIASGMELAPYKDDGNYFLTDFTKAFSAMNKIVSAPGDGSTAKVPQKYVFFVTDGVQDLPQGASSMTNPLYTQYDYWGHTLGPIDPKVCTTLKNKGVKIAVLYTTYYATVQGDSPLYDNNIAHWKNDIPSTLASCASPGFFYTADSSGIQAAMAKMFQDAVKSARITH